MSQIPFYFLGSRDYVNGLTIFEESLRAFLQDDRTASRNIKKIKRFNINQFIRTNCKLAIVESPKAVTKARLAAARMDIEMNDETLWKLLLFELMNEPVSKRLEDYDRSIYINEEFNITDSQSTVRLNNITDPFTLMRGIVEASYRHCIRLASKVGIKQGISWAYLKNFSWPNGVDYSGYTDIKFKDKPPVRIYDKIFIVRNFYVKESGADPKSEICFFYADPDFSEVSTQNA